MTKPPNGNNGVPRLPRWFALRGPRPYWLAEHSSLLVALLSALVVLFNTVISIPGISLTSEKWVNAVVAWITAAALYAKGRQPTIERIARWRQQIRDEEQPP